MGDYTRFGIVPKKWRFTINDETESLELNSNPIGWDDLRLSLTRNDTYKTMFRGYSADLEYTFDAADKLMEWQNASGILKKSNLTVEKIDTNTGLYDNVLTAKHDYVEYKELTTNKKGVSIPLIDNSFNEKLKNREDIDIAVDSDTNLDGEPITPIEYTDIILKGREFGGPNVVSYSWLDDSESQGINRYISIRYLTGTEMTAHVLRLITDDVLLFNNFQNVSKRTISEGGVFSLKSYDAYYYNEIGESELDINYNYLFDHKKGEGISLDLSLDIFIFKCNFDVDGNIIIGGVPGQWYPEILAHGHYDGVITNGIFSGNITTSLTERQGIVIYIEHIAEAPIGTGSSYFDIHENTSVNTDYFSKYNPTPCKVLLPYEICSYMAETITGEPNSFRSNYFGRTDLGYDEDGAGALIAHANGLLIRQFPTGNIQGDGSDRVAQMSFKFKEWFENFYKIRNVTFEVIIEDGKYIIVAEPQKELFKQTVSHEFSFIEKGSFERVQDLTHFYSKITCGYITQSDDLFGGLEEYISKIEHSTLLSNIQNTLELISTYSACTVPIEKQRRKPFSAYSTEEVTGDKAMFLIELWRNGEGELVQRETQGFADIIGLYGLTTKLNLGLTPKQNLLTHGWEINTGLAKFPNSIVKYNTSDKTTDLQLLKEGESVYIVENQDVVAGALDNPIWTGFKVMFSSAVSLQIYKTIEADANSLLAYPAQFGATGLNYSWIHDVSTDPKDKDVNVIGIEANPPDVATNKVLGTNKGEAIAADNGDLIGVR